MVNNADITNEAQFLLSDRRMQWLPPLHRFLASLHIALQPGSNKGVVRGKEFVRIQSLLRDLGQCLNGLGDV